MRRLILVCALLLGACGGDDAPIITGPPPPPPIPNYTGIWSGQYTITNCSQNGTIALANICGELGPVLSFLLNLGQHADSHLVQGTFNMGQVPFTIQPTTVASSGTLTFSGSTLIEAVSVLVTWNLTTPVAGTIAQVWSSAALTGQVNLTGTISNVVKTGSREAVPQPQTFEDLVRGMGR